MNIENVKEAVKEDPFYHKNAMVEYMAIGIFLLVLDEFNHENL